MQAPPLSTFLQPLAASPASTASTIRSSTRGFCAGLPLLHEYVPQLARRAPFAESTTTSWAETPRVQTSSTVSASVRDGRNLRSKTDSFLRDRLSPRGIASRGHQPS